MKGVVIEKGRDYSVLLLSDGTFKNIRSCQSYEVGDVIYTENIIKENSVPLKKVISMVAAAFIFVFLGTAAYIWATPVQYINIDINPSVELMVNRFDRIIKVKPLNDDGKKLIENISVNARHYETGIIEVINAARDLGYLEDEGDLLISISSSDAELSEKTQARIKEKVDDKIAILTFDTEAYMVSIEEGLSPGKSDIINKVIETDTSLSKEELVNVQVKDLMARINRNIVEEYEQSNLGLMNTEGSSFEEHNTDAESHDASGNNGNKNDKTDVTDIAGKTDKPDKTEHALKNNNDTDNKKNNSNLTNSKKDNSDKKTEKSNQAGENSEKESYAGSNGNVKTGKKSETCADSESGKNDETGMKKSNREKKGQNKENKDKSENSEDKDNNGIKRRDVNCGRDRSGYKNKNEGKSSNRKDKTGRDNNDSVQSGKELKNSGKLNKKSPEKANDGKIDNDKNKNSREKPGNDKIRK
ncbi:MAG TPA: hypothetical protein VIL05_14335 [Thermoclostridium sp.]